MSSSHSASWHRSPTWKWWVCGVLLLASSINYMDRQTLANASVRITRQFALSQEQYGTLEQGFGYAFALGSVVFGMLADRVSIRVLYPSVLIAWSAMGYLTAHSHGFDQLLVCRTLLGFFESAHWPCALKTTRRLLEPRDRAFGNGILQSGTSLGAIFTPMILAALLTPDPSSWRPAFRWIALAGLVWVVVWFLVIPRGALEREGGTTAAGSEGPGVAGILKDRRLWAMILMISGINLSWQLLRAWLPKFLQEGRGYPESTALWFNAAFFLASDLGCLGVGALVAWKVRRGTSVHSARAHGFCMAAGLAALCVSVPWLPAGPWLLGLLLLVGAGALGVFPCYYAWSQELSDRHQGLVSGLTGFAAWAVPGRIHPLFGRWVDRTGSFDSGLAVAGLIPILLFPLFWWTWGRDGAGQSGDSTPSASPSALNPLPS